MRHRTRNAEPPRSRAAPSLCSHAITAVWSSVLPRRRPYLDQGTVLC